MRLILSGAYFFINKNLCDLDFFRKFEMNLELLALQ